jgi:hypothetical protein
VDVVLVVDRSASMAGQSLADMMATVDSWPVDFSIRVHRCAGCRAPPAIGHRWLNAFGCPPAGPMAIPSLPGACAAGGFGGGAKGQRGIPVILL